MYVNAGTRVFIRQSSKRIKREILVEGEVYLDVAKDPSRPFIVKTNSFDVKVLGTQFNVCAYKERCFRLGRAGQWAGGSQCRKE